MARIRTMAALSAAALLLLGACTSDDDDGDDDATEETTAGDDEVAGEDPTSEGGGGDGDVVPEVEAGVGRKPGGSARFNPAFVERGVAVVEVTRATLRRSRRHLFDPRPLLVGHGHH